MAIGHFRNSYVNKCNLIRIYVMRNVLRIFSSLTAQISKARLKQSIVCRKRVSCWNAVYLFKSIALFIYLFIYLHIHLLPNSRFFLSYYGLVKHRFPKMIYYLQYIIVYQMHCMMKHSDHVFEKNKIKK